jgi:hypothetical protein
MTAANSQSGVNSASHFRHLNGKLLIKSSSSAIFPRFCKIDLTDEKDLAAIFVSLYRVFTRQSNFLGCLAVGLNPSRISQINLKIG